MLPVFRCKVRLISHMSISLSNSVVFLAIPDDIMDVDRAVNEDKDSDPNKVDSMSKEDPRAKIV